MAHLGFKIDIKDACGLRAEKITWSTEKILSMKNSDNYKIIVDKSLSMAEILGCELKTSEYEVDSARDLVLISIINNGGIISYKRTDGTYVHTLNTMDGFIRKLNNLGIKDSSQPGTSGRQPGSSRFWKVVGYNIFHF